MFIPLTQPPTHVSVNRHIPSFARTHARMYVLRERDRGSDRDSNGDRNSNRDRDSNSDRDSNRETAVRGLH